MRRVLLVLTFICCAAWSQPAQQQAQPPTVPRTENQSPKPWIHLAELAVPGIVGIAGALIGVFLTNKYNAATFADNRKHELEKLNREHSFTLKRDVLIRLTQSLVQTHNAAKLWEHAVVTLEVVDRSINEQVQRLERAKSESSAQYWSYRQELDQLTASARLAISDELWKSALAIGSSISEASSFTGNRQPARFGPKPNTALDQLDLQIADFTEAARKELGIIHIDA
jgi:hypothetical protein